MQGFKNHDPGIMAVPDKDLYVVVEKRDGSRWWGNVKELKGWYWGDMFCETSPYDIVRWKETDRELHDCCEEGFYESPDWLDDEDSCGTIPPLEDLQALLEDIKNEPLSDYFPSHIKDRLEEWT